MRINWKIIGSVALVGVLAYIVYDSNRAGVLVPLAIGTVTTQESKLAVLTPAVAEVAPESIIVESEPEYPIRINYLSVEEAFEATEQQALELLEDYKFHLSQDTSESHFGIFGIKASCMGLNFYTQRDLDDWIATAKDREKIEFKAIQLMKRVSRCREVLAFIGDKEMDDIDQMFNSLRKSADMGHPMAKLLFYKNSDHKEMTALFTDAYEYAKEFPQFKAEVYSIALRYVTSERSPTYVALHQMALRDEYIYNEVSDNPNEIINVINESLAEDYLPLDIEVINEKTEEISEAMENGDWSWLISESQ
jgi:hypothetical protein